MPDAAQIVQIVGAAAILAAFAMSQFRVVASDAYPYIALNLVGGILLLISATWERQWGFIVLEAAWTLISAWSLTGRLRRTGSLA
jgi:hypothetical protein